MKDHKPSSIARAVTTEVEDYNSFPNEICMKCHRPGAEHQYNLTANVETIQLLRSGIKIGDSETRKVQDSILCIESEIARVDDEIARLHRALDAVHERRDTLNQFKSEKQCKLAPIRRLSDDLLCRIFLELKLLADGIEFPQYPNQYPSHFIRPSFITSITQVSSYWRTLARNSPRLWIKVNIGWCADDSSRKNRMKYVLLEKCIRRSKGLPLSISFQSIDCNSTDSEDIPGESILRLTKDSTHRLETFDIGIQSAMDNILTRNNNMSLSNLRHLTIRNATRSYSLKSTPTLRDITITRGSPITISVRTAPALVFISLQYVPNPVDILQNVNWSQITHFETSSLGRRYLSDGLTTILNKMPNLLLLGITLYGETEMTGNVTLTALKQLRLSVDRFRALDLFTTPCLETLSLSARLVHSSTTDVGVPLMTLLNRSRSFLKCLTIDGVSLNETWIQNMQWLNHLKHLELVIHSMRDVRLLTIDRSSSRSASLLFPKLETLDMFLRSEADVAVNVLECVVMLLEMLNSRIHDDITNQCLRKFNSVLHSTMSLSKDKLAVIKSCLDVVNVSKPKVYMKLSYSEHYNHEVAISCRCQCSSCTNGG